MKQIEDVIKQIKQGKFASSHAYGGSAPQEDTEVFNHKLLQKAHWNASKDKWNKKLGDHKASQSVDSFEHLKSMQTAAATSTASILDKDY